MTMTKPKAKQVTTKLDATGAAVRSLHDKLSETVSVKDFGAIGSGDETTNFQSAIDALPASGGRITIPAGTYTLTPALLSVGSKVVVWECDGGVTLPSGMPGSLIDMGTRTLSQDSLTTYPVKLPNLYNFGSIKTSASSYEWGIHVTGFLSDTGVTTGDREFRGYSFDLGTNTTYNQEDIRGIKGRVYATGGNGNIRAIYGYAEGYSGHTGQLTGLIGTITMRPGCTAYSAAVRGHLNGSLDSSSTNFSAAGNGGTATPGYAYLVRGSTDAVETTVADFCTHGTGTGDAFLVFSDKNSTDKTVAPYRVKKTGTVKEAAVFSRTVTLSDDTATFVTPPNFSGFVEVWADTASQLWGKIYFRTFGTALAQKCYGGTLFAETTGVLSGTTGADTFITVSADSVNNRIYIENRTGASRNINLFFVAAA